MQLVAFTEFVRSHVTSKQFQTLLKISVVVLGALGAANDKPGTTRSHFVFAKGGKLVEKELPVTPTDRCVLAFLSSLTR